MSENTTVPQTPGGEVPEENAAAASVTPILAHRIPLIAGNWKMNLDHLQAIALVQKLAWSLQDVRHNFAEVEVAVFPPFTDLRSVQTLLAADKFSIALGAQDASPHQSGAYTGDIAAQFLSKLDTRYVIVGHSERRQGHGEDDELVAQKAAAVAANDMVPLICVGETANERDTHGSAVVPLAQLEAVLARLPQDAQFVVAYEPVWAIGSGVSATAEQAEQVCAALRERMAVLLGEQHAAETRILYGGSVTSQNVAELLNQPNLDGVLVGGSSLDVQEFCRIVQFKKHITAA